MYEQQNLKWAHQSEFCQINPEAYQSIYKALKLFEYCPAMAKSAPPHFIYAAPKN